jgi:UDP-N-acetylmuramyl pentapeptide synthase
MQRGGTAIVNRDMPEWETFSAEARRYGLRLSNFGKHQSSDVRLIGYDPAVHEVSVELDGHGLRFRVGSPGEHMAMNSLSCIAALRALDLPIEKALSSFADFRPIAGRGALLDVEFRGKALRIIDETYNANPASMAAAIRLLREVHPPNPDGRRVVILADMLELGTESAALHAGLTKDLLSVSPDLILLCGQEMESLMTALGRDLTVAWWAEAEDLNTALESRFMDGDLILIKGSHRMGLGPLVDTLKSGG